MGFPVKMFSTTNFFSTGSWSLKCSLINCLFTSAPSKRHQYILCHQQGRKLKKIGCDCMTIITIIVTYIFKMLWCISCVHVLKEIYFKGGSMVESIIFRWCPSFFLLSNQDFIQSKNESIKLQSFIPKWFVNFWICDFSSVFNVQNFGGDVSKFWKIGKYWIWCLLKIIIWLEYK